MSLTDKEKEIALEVAHRRCKTYRHKAEEPYSFDEGCMIHAFDTFLSRIREEQEAIGTFVEEPYGWREVHKNSPYYELGTKLFTTPPATLPSGNRSECDCEELVEALERVLKWVAPIAGDNSDRRAAAEEEMSMTCAIAALTNHAKRMKGY